MERRYLFGPVSVEFAEQCLGKQRRSGQCLAFGEFEAIDVAMEGADSWAAVCAQLPGGWRPDFIVLNLPYTKVPTCLWTAPVPIVGLAGDWNLLWHWYRRSLKNCDLVLTDEPGVEVLHREGIRHVRAANLYGYERSFSELPAPETHRDIDILFVGNLHPAVQRDRLAWLGRLARMSDRRRVAIHTGVFGDAYRGLLQRARIVFNRSIRGECNRRALEAAAAGAVLFQEAGNREVPDYFDGTQDCVYYRDDNLEKLLDHYLDHEDERQSIAEAAGKLAASFSHEALWDRQVDVIEGEWPELITRAAGRVERGEPLDPDGRVWQALCQSKGCDPGLSQDIATALAREPRSAAMQHALGLAVTLDNRAAGLPFAEVAERACGYFQRAAEKDPLHVMANLNLAEALAISGRPQAAVEAAQRALALVDQEPSRDLQGLDAGHFPPGFDFFRVEWEKAAWRHAGDAPGEALVKRGLIRWRLHQLLADATESLPQRYEAVLARPDLPSTQASLGFALAECGQTSESISHFRAALNQNPFDCNVARGLFQALGQCGDGEAQRRLADDRRLLTRAAPELVPVEPWMERVPAVGDELASIIVLCCNELQFTRLCLESVLRHTRTPYELVVVDNGSADDTPAYLEEIRTRRGPARVVVIRNDFNRGFAAGCNQALARTRGRYLVFLNNDAVVSDGWLAGLVGWALHDWPQVGLVGPVSNYAPPPQHVQGDYRELGALDSFAIRRRQEFAGKAITVERLTGFCLLARREVIERVGGFDEGYGLGFFEDDDLCVRAREAGFRLLVAQDVFIHHFGSRTFTGLDIDGSQQLEMNFERFRAKWGQEHAAGYRMPGPAQDDHAVLTSPLPRGKTREQVPVARKYSGRVSLCMIVKNEEANLPACLGSAADLVDEMIVVDTGSTDATRAVAEKCGARVYDFTWIDDFAAARNESLRHATGDWIFWLDGDDRIDEANRQKLKSLFAGLKDENCAYAMKCRCLPDPQTGTATVVDHVRLFRNYPGIRWKYRVHEQVLPAVRSLGGSVASTAIVIEHTGYVDRALRHKKQERDIRILELDRAEHPDDPFILFNLGWSYEELRRAEEALPLLRRSLELSHPTDSIVRKLYTLVMECHRQLGQSGEALVVCQEGRRYYPDDAQLLFQEALLRRELGDRGGAEACLVHLLSTKEGPHFASISEGLRGHKARHNLAVIYQEQGRFAEAEAHWKSSLCERPAFTPAWIGLGELYLSQRRFAELDNVLGLLAGSDCKDDQAQVAATALGARCSMARGEFARARQVLDGAIQKTPNNVWLWVILSHALLQEGKDWGAAEAALRKVLEIDPKNAEANKNLATLLRQRQGAA
jgi:GT2 family glycosyltransferase/tetratricopeptide (TPR) repeat protein